MRKFCPAEISDFHRHHRQFGELFTPGGPGNPLWAMINSEAAHIRMTVANDALDLPAVAGVAKDCWHHVAAASTPARRKQIASAIGGMVRTVLVANGRRTTHQKRAVPPLMIDGEWRRVFRTGEVYA